VLRGDCEARHELKAEAIRPPEGGRYKVKFQGNVNGGRSKQRPYGPLCASWWRRRLRPATRFADSSATAERRREILRGAQDDGLKKDDGVKAVPRKARERSLAALASPRRSVQAGSLIKERAQPEGCATREGRKNARRSDRQGWNGEAAAPTQFNDKEFVEDCYGTFIVGLGGTIYLHLVCKNSRRVCERR
jgi:hypothetical protein